MARPPPTGKSAWHAGGWRSALLFQRPGGDCHRWLALLRAGDEVLILTTPWPNKALAGAVAPLRHSPPFHYDPLDVDDLIAQSHPATRLVWRWKPGSVTAMEFPDLIALVGPATSHGALLPALCAGQHLGFGLALRRICVPMVAAWGWMCLSNTLLQMPSGGGDVLMGSMVARDERLHQQLKLTHMHLGLGVVPTRRRKALLRGLPSMALRYHAQNCAARQLAQWLASKRPWCRCCTRPPAAPGTRTGKPCAASAAAAMPSSAGGRRTVQRGADARYTQAQVDAFCDSLRLFALAAAGWPCQPGHAL